LTFRRSSLRNFANSKKECPTVGRFVILVARLLFVFSEEKTLNKRRIGAFSWSALVWPPDTRVADALALLLR
jgi:hypothetical protein